METNTSTIPQVYRNTTKVVGGGPFHQNTTLSSRKQTASNNFSLNKDPDSSGKLDEESKDPIRSKQVTE
jgi:hypothetical protein